jgi:hypothetical protein
MHLMTPDQCRDHVYNTQERDSRQLPQRSGGQRNEGKSTRSNQVESLDDIQTRQTGEAR